MAIGRMLGKSEGATEEKKCSLFAVYIRITTDAQTQRGHDETTTVLCKLYSILFALQGKGTVAECKRHAKYKRVEAYN
jgi:hypothetical protein